jgi:hypothetical protein
MLETREAQVEDAGDPRARPVELETAETAATAPATAATALTALAAAAMAPAAAAVLRGERTAEPVY